MTPVEREALRIWQEREMRFEPRLRRMRPDTIDMATGAWIDCLFQAAENLRDGMIPKQTSVSL
jgi:hypothetical protein